MLWRKNKRLFVSHSYQDSDLITALTELLSKQYQLVIFPPITVPVSNFVSDSLFAAIDSCDALLWIASTNSINSFWVALEIEYAKRRGKSIYSIDRGAKALHLDEDPLTPIKIYASFDRVDEWRVRSIATWLKHRRSFDILHNITGLGGDEIRSVIAEGGFVVAFLSSHAISNSLIIMDLISAQEAHPDHLLIVWLDNPDTIQVPPKYASLYSAKASVAASDKASSFYSELNVYLRSTPEASGLLKQDRKRLMLRYKKRFNVKKLPVLACDLDTLVVRLIWLSRKWHDGFRQIRPLNGERVGVTATRNRSPVGRVALLEHGTLRYLDRVQLAFAKLGLATEYVSFADDASEALSERLFGFDAVLVSVPEFKTRTRLDALLHYIKTHGVLVSAEPSIIKKMGTKEVLYRTRELSWGADTHLYNSFEQFREEFPKRIATSGSRVLKQNQSDYGVGVWQIELLPTAEVSDPDVRVVQCKLDRKPYDVKLSSFMAGCAQYFVDDGLLIDQGYQHRHIDGTIRCCMSQNEVVGFCHQLRETSGSCLSISHYADAPPFQSLRAAMEQEWVPAMQRILDISTADLPVLWDASFVYGAKAPNGADTYVLCGINASNVRYISDPLKVAATTLRAIQSKTHC
jgi:hypothetical protein